MPALIAVLALTACASGPERRYDSRMEKAADVNAQLGAQYLRNGNLDLAKEKLDKALQQNSDSAAAHAAYGLLSMRLNDPGGARDHFETALDLDPENPQVLNNYGTFLCGEGDHEEGVARFIEAAENPLYSTPAYAYANAGRCARQAGDTRQAREHLLQALSLDRRMATALYDLARLQLDRGRPGSARDYVERYHEVATAAPESLWLGVRAGQALGDRKLADDYGKRLLRDFPDTPEADRFLETR